MFDVYVDGATVASHDTLVALASAIALRQRVAADDLAVRLMHGPLCIAAGVPRAIADDLRRELEALGARIRIEPTGANAPPSDAPYASPQSHRTVASRGARRTLPQSPTSPTSPSPRSAAAALPAIEPVLPPAAAPRPLQSTPLAGTPRPIAVRLPAADDARPTRSSLPPQPARAIAPILPPPGDARPARSSLPPRVPAVSLPPPWEQLPNNSQPTWQQQPNDPQPTWQQRPNDPQPTWETLGATERSGLLTLDLALTADGDLDPYGDVDLRRESELVRARADAPAPAPRELLPASMGPPVASPAALELAKHVRFDPFTPPALGQAEPALELAEPLRGSRTIIAGGAGHAQRPASDRRPPDTEAQLSATEPATPTSTAPPRPGRAEPAAVAPGSATVSGSTVAQTHGRAAHLPALASPRVRLAAGVMLAIVLGFVPAHLVADVRERQAFGAIDAAVTARQAAADTSERYAALDAFRAEQRAAKRSARRWIVISSLVIWAAAGGALAYAWFRRLPWQRPA